MDNRKKITAAVVVGVLVLLVLAAFADIRNIRQARREKETESAPLAEYWSEGSAPAQPKGPGWSSGRALAASLVSRWQVTTLLSSPP